MKLKSLIAHPTLLTILLGLAAVCLLLLFLPRTDRQSFSYELNQPWKYPLLTAEFDTPILRDSASQRAMRDSIDQTFIPFVTRDDEMGRRMAARFARQAAGAAPSGEISRISRLIQETYDRGIVSPTLYADLHHLAPPRMRVTDTSPSDLAAVTSDASAVLSSAMAFRLIDSLYLHTGHHSKEAPARLSKAVADALSAALAPNITLDSVTDSKFRSEQYLAVSGALGVIKKGQRIVDRGEIITPQIFTNLNTYQEVLAKNQADNNGEFLFFLGQALYLAIVFASFLLFLFFYRPNIFADLKTMSFLIGFVTLFDIFAIEMFEYVNNGIYLVPFAIVPVIVTVFTDTRTAIFSLLTAVLAVALIATFPFQFIFTELCVGIAATFSLHQLTRRSQLLRTAAVTFLVYCLCYVTLALVNEGSFALLSWRMVSIYAINSVILSFAYVLILVVEKAFGFTSLVTLVELTDINTPLLRKMAEVAPGTFQHSIQVSTLASEAARAIGANSLLTRAGALYHDIGKTESPIFFTENQHGVNPHAGLDPATSAQKIISHVTSGQAMAAREKLPAVIRAFISEHHGRSLAKYFYNTAVNEAKEGETVDPELFRYPGPDPQSRETAILMMADCVEAASRSLKDYSKSSIDQLVDRLVDSIVADGRLKEAPISLRDIETIKATFKKRLATIYHSRIAYPDIKKPAEPAAEPTKAPSHKTENPK